MKDYINSSSASPQLQLFDTVDEARLYLQADGYFAVLSSTPAGGKRQDFYRTSQTSLVLPLYARLTDVWASQAVYFSRRRCVANVKCLDLSFLDIDYYKSDIGWAAGKSPERVAQDFMEICDAEEVPRPSLIVHSGRGLQPKWLFSSSIPRPALKRWGALQTALIDKFLPFGADPAVRDAARVLRVPQTFNSRNNSLCHVAALTADETGQPIRYGFDYLCEFVLPKARPDKRRITSYVRKEQRRYLPEERVRKAQSLAWARLEDMRTLCSLRGGMPEGMRMNALMYTMNFMALSGEVHEGNFDENVDLVAREIDPTWAFRSKELSTVFAKMLKARDGEKVEFNGKKFSPLYTPKSETLINLFEITTDEMRQLTSIVTPDERRRRDADSHMKRRRAQGVKPRAEYLGQAKARQERAKALRAKGWSIRRIAQEMGLSVGSISGYLNSKS